MADKKEQPHKVEITETDESGAAPVESEEEQIKDIDRLKAELDESNNKYLRLYAEFDNYKKRVRKEKEEFLAYCNEDLLYELLPAIDNLEMALKHTSEGKPDALQSLKQGVENTLRELNRTLDKFGL